MSGALRCGFRLLLLGLLTTACAGSSGAEAEPRKDVFLAFAEDFRGYHAWHSFDVTDGAASVGITDGSQITAYMNRLPPSGSEAFPVGTIIVKEATGGSEAHDILCMVKRGGGFNVDLPGWEWIDISNLDDGRDGARINWRGVGPPSGETYGGDPNIGCNKCHLDCPDGVCAPQLALTNF